MPLSSPESQEKLLKNVFEITHSPHSSWQKSFAKLIKRTGEDSSAHFWAYGYYSEYVAQLIECDAGHHDPIEYGCLSRGFNSRTADVATILANYRRDESQGDRDKKERFGDVAPSFSLSSPTLCSPSQRLDGWIQLIL